MIAYFVMEMGLEEGMPTYSGGLGVLAGDTMYSFADLGISAVGVSLLYKKGYVQQGITPTGIQLDFEDPWNFRRYLKPLDIYVDVPFGDRLQKVTAWEFRIEPSVKVFFLDADIETNDDDVRKLNYRLYYEDGAYRLKQEILLGIGGYRILKALGYDIKYYHLNESHAAFLIVDLLSEFKDIQEVKKRCVFLTHTPLPAGHDKFPVRMVKEELKTFKHIDWDKEATGGELNLTHFALKYSGRVGAVSYKHFFVCKDMFPEREDFEYITNGVYHRRWVHPVMRDAFFEYIPGWEENPVLLSGAINIPSEIILRNHFKIKQELVNFVNKNSDASFSVDNLTICVARRVTPYKRNDLILKDLERLLAIAQSVGEIQLLFSGKAHPKDNPGKEIISNIINVRKSLKEHTKSLRIAFLENYSIKLSALLTAGCDVWLNNPRRPLEACGTSGMKAALNGVLNFSTWDGWWLEGGIEGFNGWGIGPKPKWADLSLSDDNEDLKDLYGKLEYIIVPMYYQKREQWSQMMKNSIATVGVYFNGYRMVKEYISKLYRG
ncbi:MAG: alpha-glucan family phosphorylase [Aquificaceae bacterium]